MRPRPSLLDAFSVWLIATLGNFGLGPHLFRMRITLQESLAHKRPVRKYLRTKDVRNDKILTGGPAGSRLPGLYTGGARTYGLYAPKS